MVKSVKGQKKYRKKRSSTKLFKIDKETAKGVGLGVLAAAGVLSLGYAGVLAPIIKKNRLKAQEDREAATIATTVERRMIERRDSAKNKALKAFEDLKALGNSVLTSPRPSGIYSPTSTVKGSPRMSVAPKTPVFSVLDSITVVPKSSPVLRTQIPPGGNKGSSSKNLLNTFYYVKKSRNPNIFTKDQKRMIISLIKSDKDTSDYVKNIVGADYVPSKITLDKTEPPEFHLHVIKGAVLGNDDISIAIGLAKLREKAASFPIFPSTIKVADMKKSK